MFTSETNLCVVEVRHNVNRELVPRTSNLRRPQYSRMLTFIENWALSLLYKVQINVSSAILAPLLEWRATNWTCIGRARYLLTFLNLYFFLF